MKISPHIGFKLSLFCHKYSWRGCRPDVSRAWIRPDAFGDNTDDCAPFGVAAGRRRRPPRALPWPQPRILVLANGSRRRCSCLRNFVSLHRRTTNHVECGRGRRGGRLGRHHCRKVSADNTFESHLLSIVCSSFDTRYFISEIYY